MSKAVELIEYIAGVHFQNAVALPKQKPRTKEGKAYVAFFAESAKKHAQAMAVIRKHVKSELRAAARRKRA